MGWGEHDAQESALACVFVPEGLPELAVWGEFGCYVVEPWYFDAPDDVKVHAGLAHDLAGNAVHVGAEFFLDVEASDTRGHLPAVRWHVFALSVDHVALGS